MEGSSPHLVSTFLFFCLPGKSNDFSGNILLSENDTRLLLVVLLLRLLLLILLLKAITEISIVSTVLSKNMCHNSLVHKQNDKYSEIILCLMSSDVMRHIRDNKYNQSGSFIYTYKSTSSRHVGVSHFDNFAGKGKKWLLDKQKHFCYCYCCCWYYCVRQICVWTVV